MIRSGIDIIEIARIQKAVSRHDGFLPRFFTAEECAYFASRGNAAECIAGHFAAKEAFAKFLGSGVRGFALKDISVLHDRCGKPYLTFRGRSVPADLSISHSRTDAVAVVCGEEWRREFAYDFPRYAAMLPARESSANKGDCGKVLILAGSRGMTGAACLSANAALRTGSGLVTVAAPQSVQPVLACKLTEAMTLPLQEEEGEISPAAAETIFSRMGRADVCVFGPGLGTGRGVSAALKKILGQKQPILIDADGINVLSANIDILKTKSCRAVLTPHPGEMSRLTGKPIAEIQSSRVDTAVRFAAEYGVTLVLKGEGTVVAFPDGQYRINPSGNAGMATGGSGDVLSGIIGSLIGQGCSVEQAAELGVFLHGLAGDLAKQEKGEYGMIASDLISCLPKAIQTILSYRTKQEGCR